MKAGFDMRDGDRPPFGSINGIAAPAGWVLAEWRKLKSEGNTEEPLLDLPVNLLRHPSQPE